MEIKFTTATSLNTAIKRVCLALNKSQTYLHDVALSAIDHARAHNNTTPLANLLNGLPKSVRVKSLKVWVQEFAPIDISGGTDGAEFVVRFRKKDRKDDDYRLEEANSNPFWVFTQEKEPKALDIAALIAILRNKAKSTDEKKVLPEARQLAAALVQFAEENKSRFAPPVVQEVASGIAVEEREELQAEAAARLEAREQDAA